MAAAAAMEGRQKDQRQRQRDERRPERANGCLCWLLLFASEKAFLEPSGAAAAATAAAAVSGWNDKKGGCVRLLLHCARKSRERSRNRWAPPPSGTPDTLAEILERAFNGSA